VDGCPTSNLVTIATRFSPSARSVTADSCTGGQAARPRTPHRWGWARAAGAFAVVEAASLLSDASCVSPNH